MSEQTQDRSSDTGEYPTPQPGRSARLLLPMRLAVRFLWGGDLTDRVRALLTVVAIALSASVVLLTLAALSALDHRDERSAALTPTYVISSSNPPSGSSSTIAEQLLATPRLFFVDVQQQPYRGQSVTIMQIARPTGTNEELPPPPGTSIAPGPGQALLSPALADLLASPAGDDLRARLPESVVGIISTDELLDDSELRAYVGTSAKTIDPNSGSMFDLATGWGEPSIPDSLRSGPTLRILLLAGIVVVVTPLLVLIGLLGRLGGPARSRRLYALRLLGAPPSVTRSVVVGESTVLGLAGGALATLGFPLITRVVRGLPLDGVPLSAQTLTLSPLILIGCAVGVGLLTALTSSMGIGGRPGRTRRDGERPPRWRSGVTLFVLGLTLVAVGLTNGGLYGSGMLLALCAGLALSLVSVSSLAGPAVATAARLLRQRGPLSSLAAARVAADPRARAATVAGVGVVLAGAIALQAVLVLVSADRTAPGGSISPAYRVSLTPASAGLTVGDITEVGDVLVSAPGVEQITGGLFLPGEVDANSAAPSSGSYRVSRTVDMMIAPCAAIPERVDCRDGDVFEVDQTAITGARPTVPPAGAVIRVDTGGGSVDWSTPTLTGDVDLEPALRDTVPYELFVTPGALGTLANVPASAASIDLRVFGAASIDTADRLRSELSARGWRVELDSTAEATGTRGNLLVVGRAGLTGTAALTLLAALGGLLVLTFTQVNRSRRAVTLALAAGWPRAVVRRSLVLEAAISAAAVVPIATAVAYGLAAVLTQLGRPTTDLPSFGMTAAMALGAAAVTVLAAWLAATLAVRTVDVTDLRTG